jgi:para-nitrobenzyl esterase
MNVGRVLGCCAAMLFLSGSITFAADKNKDDVKVESGMLRGVSDAGVVSYKGVPYAAPPTGNLRWKAPQPAAHWNGVRTASQFGHDCMQLPFPSDAAPLGTKPDEDCLVMNVWAPAAPTSSKLPVMVWIWLRTSG